MKLTSTRATPTTISPAITATYQVGLGSFAFADGTACEARGGFFGLRRFDSGIPARA
jgi:hypothetical protein